MNAPMESLPATASRTVAEPSPLATLKSILKPVASLQLTVALFALSLVLVFFGTLAQKNAGIWTVVEQYFWSWHVSIDLQLFVEFLQIFFDVNRETATTINVPFPAGKLIGGLMFVNLLAAHFVRFRLSWRRSGIMILHSGLLMMFVGEYVTREFAIEQQMAIEEGTAVSHTISTREYELAIIRQLDDTNDRVVTVPGVKLARGIGREPLTLPDELPVRVKVLAYSLNSELVNKELANDPNAVYHPAATQGFGVNSRVKEIEPVSGVSNDKRVDMPAVTIELLRASDNESLGVYSVSMKYRPQPVTIDGTTFTLEYRNIVYHKPYTVYLEKFRFDRYLGTNKPKNYSSTVLLTDSEKQLKDTQIVISMNSPMHHRGETFYQSSFTPDEKTTILSVVENPGWTLPYVSFGLVSFGMLLHFGIHLREYLRKMMARKAAADVSPPTLIERWLPWGVLAVTVLLISAAAMPHGKPGLKGLDLERVAMLPVVDGGRVKPLDTVARVDLRLLNHKEFYNSPADKTSRPAIDWWLSTASTTDFESANASHAEVFRIENDQVLNLLGLPRRDGLRYSLLEIGKKYKELRDAAVQAEKKPARNRDLFDGKVLDLWTKLGTHNGILTGETTLVIPPRDGKDWQRLTEARQAAQERTIKAIGEQIGINMPSGKALVQMVQSLPEAERRKFETLFNDTLDEQMKADPALQAWDDLFTAYRAGDKDGFDKAVSRLEQQAQASVSISDRVRVRLEVMLNDTAFYFWCTGLYVFAFVLTLASWAFLALSSGIGHAWRRSAMMVLLFAFILQTITLLVRMYLMDRPFVFVTNLYSTAVFIGWVTVGVSLLVERAIPLTLGNLTAAVIGFLTCILAHNLALSGDTLEMMQAVLDTNFWLATHVTTINIGYATTYIAGLIGMVYIAIGLFTPYLFRKVSLPNGQSIDLGRLIGQMLYGAVAASVVLSFIGTVLGGIWGDYSWGRFWGWDPKENGALMIVLWSAMILHARWAGLVKDHGIAVLAIGGNIITTWSYFGTNQLDYGLHFYGRNETLAAICRIMWITNLAIVAIGLTPQSFWRSQRATASAAD
jgi:ABC-type transport system involved in cytochrome c biogenesis permease subunit